jgi:uncharacterized protein YqeY
MTLEKLQNTMVQAMKSGDKFRKGVISDVIAQVKRAAIDKGCRDNISENLVDEVLTKCKKIAQEMIDTCPSERIETMDEYRKQFNIINEFAPQLINGTEEIHDIIVNVSVASGWLITKPNRGQIMKAIKATYGNKVDMGAVNKVLGEMLK